MQKTILKLTRVYFEGVQLAGSLLSGLKPYYPVMVAKFVDAVLETVTIALDEPRVASQQRYLTSLKLIGELYNYKVVDNLLVFAVLYAIINRGHALRPGTRSYSNALRLCVVNPSTDLGLPDVTSLSSAEVGPGQFLCVLVANGVLCSSCLLGWQAVCVSVCMHTDEAGSHSVKVPSFGLTLPAAHARGSLTHAAVVVSRSVELRPPLSQPNFSSNSSVTSWQQTFTWHVPVCLSLQPLLPPWVAFPPLAGLGGPSMKSSPH